MSVTIVRYNNNELVPVNNISISHSMGQSASDECLRPTYNIEIQGTLIYNMGSPTSSGDFGSFTAEQCESIDSENALQSLLAKHCAVGNILSEHYQKLELGLESGLENLTAYPKILSFTIDDTSRWNYWPYTISMEADALYCGGEQIGSTGCGCVRSYDETWEISYDENEVISESGDNRLWKVTHSISAVGAGVTNESGLIKSPYECAKDFVCARKGEDAIIPSVCIDGFSGTGELYNYYESHSVDINGGSYSLTESWFSTNNPYIEQYTVEESESSDQACPTVSINGSIRGFEIRQSGIVTTSKYQNALSRFNEIVDSGILQYAEDLSGYNLDPYPVNSTIGRNRYTGEITYSNTYKHLPFRWLASAKSERVSVSNNFGEDIYAEITLLGVGQVMHPLAMDNSGNITGRKLPKRTLSIDAVYPCGTGISRNGPRFSSGYSTEIESVINYYNPTGDSDVYLAMVESQSETWDPQLGSYQYSITWTVQNTGLCELI